jgi:hypothetical protein
MVPNDEIGALRWLQKAADQDHPAALFQLRLLQAQGLKTTPDYGRQLQVYQQAADQGDPSAAYNLGLLHAQGLGTPRDLARAAQCYARAIKGQIAAAHTNLGVLLALQAASSPGSEGAGQALMHLQTAADQDDALAHYNLGQMRLQGLVLPKDLQQAKLSFGRAGALGYAPALVQLAALCGPDEGTQALALLQEASAQGDARAWYQLGQMHFQGERVPQDLAQALHCYSHAAELGDSAAQFSLGSMYANGRGTAQDYALALRWYQAAAGQAPTPALASTPGAPAPAPADTGADVDLRKAA